MRINWQHIYNSVFRNLKREAVKDRFASPTDNLKPNNLVDSHKQEAKKVIHQRESATDSLNTKIKYLATIGQLPLAIPKDELAEFDSKNLFDERAALEVEKLLEVLIKKKNDLGSLSVNFKEDIFINLLILGYSTVVYAFEQINVNSEESNPISNSLNSLRKCISSLVGRKNSCNSMHSLLQIYFNPNFDQELIYIIEDLIDVPGIEGKLQSLIKEYEYDKLSGIIGELYNAHKLQEKGYRIVSFGFDITLEDEENNKTERLEVDLVLEKDGRYYLAENKYFGGKSGLENEEYENVVSWDTWKDKLYRDLEEGVISKGEKYKLFLKYVIINDINDKKAKKLKKTLIDQGLSSLDLERLYKQVESEKKIPIVFSYSRKAFPSLSCDKKEIVLPNDERIILDSPQNNPYAKVFQEMIEKLTLETSAKAITINLELIPFKLLNNSYTIYKNTAEEVKTDEWFLNQEQILSSFKIEQFIKLFRERSNVEAFMSKLTKDEAIKVFDEILNLIEISIFVHFIHRSDGNTSKQYVLWQDITKRPPSDLPLFKKVLDKKYDLTNKLISFGTS